jgi:hypothetical protein
MDQNNNEPNLKFLFIGDGVLRILLIVELIFIY